MESPPTPPHFPHGASVTVTCDDVGRPPPLFISGCQVGAERRVKRGLISADQGSGDRSAGVGGNHQITIARAPQPADVNENRAGMPVEHASTLGSLPFRPA